MQAKPAVQGSNLTDNHQNQPSHPPMTIVAQEKDPEKKLPKKTTKKLDSPPPSAHKLPGEKSGKFIPLVEEISRSSIPLHSPDDTRIISVEEQEDRVGLSLSASLSSIILDIKATGSSASFQSDNCSALPNWQQVLSTQKENNAAKSGHQKFSPGSPTRTCLLGGVGDQLESNVKSHANEKMMGRCAGNSPPFVSSATASQPATPSPSMKGVVAVESVSKPTPSAFPSTFQKPTYSMVIGQALQNAEGTSAQPSSGEGSWKAVGDTPRKSIGDFPLSVSDPLFKEGSAAVPSSTGNNGISGSNIGNGTGNSSSLGGRMRASSVLEPSFFSSSNTSLWSNETNCTDSSRLSLNPMNQFTHWLPEIEISSTAGSFSENGHPSALSALISSGCALGAGANPGITGHVYGPIGGEARAGSVGSRTSSFRSRSKSQSFAFSSSPSLIGSSRVDFDQDCLFNSSIPLFDVPSTSALLHAERPSQNCTSPEKGLQTNSTFNESLHHYQLPALPNHNAAEGNGQNEFDSESSPSGSNEHSFLTGHNVTSSTPSLPINIVAGQRNSPCQSKPLGNPAGFTPEQTGDLQMHNLGLFRNFPPSPTSSSFAYSYPHNNHFSGIFNQHTNAHVFDGNEESFPADQSSNSHSVYSNSRSSSSSQYKQSSPFQLSTYKGQLFLVEFKSGRTEVMYVQEGNGQPEFSISTNDYIIVEADRGEDLGKVVGEISIERMKQIMNDPDSATLTQSEAYSGIGTKEIVPKRIHRLARPADVRLLQTKAQEEAIAMLRCQSKVRQKKLPMEVVDAEYQWDRNKLTFYFLADRRIDFRELVRDLFRIYKTRIWMCAVDKHRMKLLSGGSQGIPEGSFGFCSGDEFSFSEQQQQQQSCQHLFDEEFPDDLNSLH